MTMTKTAARHFCSCGRGFYNHAGASNHGRKCPLEIARSAAFVKAIEEGRKASMDPAATVQIKNSPGLGGWVLYTCEGFIGGTYPTQTDAIVDALARFAS